MSQDTEVDVFVFEYDNQKKCIELINTDFIGPSTYHTMLDIIVFLNNYNQHLPKEGNDLYFFFVCANDADGYLHEVYSPFYFLIKKSKEDFDNNKQFGLLKVKEEGEENYKSFLTDPIRDQKPLFDNIEDNENFPTMFQLNEYVIELDNGLFVTSGFEEELQYKIFNHKYYIQKFKKYECSDILRMICNFLMYYIKDDRYKYGVHHLNSKQTFIMPDNFFVKDGLLSQKEIDSIRQIKYNHVFIPSTTIEDMSNKLPKELFVKLMANLNPNIGLLFYTGEDEAFYQMLFSKTIFLDKLGTSDEEFKKHHFNNWINPVLKLLEDHFNNHEHEFDSEATVDEIYELVKTHVKSMNFHLLVPNYDYKNISAEELFRSIDNLKHKSGSFMSINKYNDYKSECKFYHPFIDSIRLVYDTKLYDQYDINGEFFIDNNDGIEYYDIFSIIKHATKALDIFSKRFDIRIYDSFDELKEKELSQHRYADIASTYDRYEDPKSDVHGWFCNLTFE